jgi:DNA gyrase subunit B
MNDREFEDFFLTTWVQAAAVKVPGIKQPVSGDALLELLRQVSEYRGHFTRLTRRGVPGPLLAQLLRAKFRSNKRGIGHGEIAEAITAAGAAVNGDQITVQAGENGDPHTVVVAGPPTVSFSTELIKSQDYVALYELWEKLAAVAKGPTVVIEGEQEIAVEGLDELHRVSLERSRQGATFQRYKGLGEMNPEQLWETTMNPETRTLLRVTMADAVGADQIFTVLMGDAVEPRREFIEKHALDVENLDV